MGSISKGKTGILLMTTDEQISHLKKFCQRGEMKSISEAIACGGTEWLRDWLKENLPQIIDLEDTPSDHEAAKEWDSKAKEMMAARGLKTPHQQKNRFTDIRNAIRTIDPDHPTLADIGFTTEQWEEINRPSEIAVGDRSTKFITDPEAVVSIAIELLNSRDWWDLAASLAVLTGRRCAEILKTAQLDYRTPYSVWFVGAVKKGTEKAPPEFEIPTLAPSQRIIATITKLRQWVDTTAMDNRAVNSQYAGRVIQACDRHFKDLVPPRDGRDNLYTHLFRAVYATIATHWYCPPTVPALEYRAYIQGHFKAFENLEGEQLRSLAAQRHYFDYAIGDGEGNVDGRLGIKLGLPGVEVISVFKSYYQPFLRVQAPVTPEPQEQLITVSPTPTEENSDRQPNNPTSTGVEENQEMAQTPIEQSEQSLPSHGITSTSTLDPSTPLTTLIDTEQQLAPTTDEPKQLTLQELQQTIISMLRSSSYTVVLAALMATTRRSPGELLKSKVIEINPDNPLSVLFRSTIDNKVIVLPTLIEGSIIVKAIALLKKHKSVKDLLYLAPKDIDLHCIAQIKQKRIIAKYFFFSSIDQLYQAYSAAIDEQAHFPSIPIPIPIPIPTPTYTPTQTSKKRNKKEPETAKSEKGTPKGKAGSTPTTSKRKTPKEEEENLIDSWGKVALSLKERFGLSQPEQLIQLLEQHFFATKGTQETAQQQALQGTPDNLNTLDVPPTAEAASHTSEDDISLNPTSPPVIAGAEVDNSPTDPQMPGVDKTKADISVTAASVENASNHERTSRLEEMFELNQTSIHQLSKDIAQLVNSLSLWAQGLQAAAQLPHSHSPQPTAATPVKPECGTRSAPQSTTSITRRATQKTSSNSTEAESSSGLVKPKNTASREKINRAIDLIMDLNNSATTKKDKWLVSLSALKQLTKCGQDTITRVLNERASEIENHHALHELGKFHNNKGKFAPAITEVIQLTPPIK